MFGGDEFKAVAAYNGGEHAVHDWTSKFPGPDDEWVENIGYRETRDYVKRVIGGRREYLLLYQRQAPAASTHAGRPIRGLATLDKRRGKGLLEAKHHGRFGLFEFVRAAQR